MRRLLPGIAVAALVLVPSARPVPPAFRMTSTFGNYSMIPKRYTCDGLDVSPPLRWTKPPRGTQSLAIDVVDTDAIAEVNGDLHFFVQWSGWAIPPRAGALREGTAPPVQGANSFGLIGYGGPCPPRGSRPHHYLFTIYALRVRPELRAGASWEQFRVKVLNRHVLALAYVAGRYARR